MKAAIRLSFWHITVTAASALPEAAAAAADESWVNWTRSQAMDVAKPMRRTGRIGSVWATRGTHTERALNYHLRATWMTPDVIRAVARLQQLDRFLSAAETRQLVDEAESVGDTVILIEIPTKVPESYRGTGWRSCAPRAAKATKPREFAERVSRS